jgi:gliding-associated putative ABC transporter substrate-binding component GldG
MSKLQKILASKYGWLALLIVLFLINYIASVIHSRIDLTKEKRYTLSKATRDLLRNLDDKVEIDVFLKGEFPAGFRKLANSTSEFLQLLKDRNGSKIQYRFISPQDEMPGGGVYADTLTEMGAVPINLTVQKKEGESSNIIFPVAVLHYKGKRSLVNLYPGASGRISQEETNSAEALMEYQFAKALDKLARDKKPGIAYAVGNGEPVDPRTYDMVQVLQQDYEFRVFNLKQQPGVPDSVDVLLIVKPAEQFTEAEKLKIDQFVMTGGKLLCFIDNLIAEQDSLAYQPETVAFDRNLNLTDLFFKYGLRINTDLVMDLQCDAIPLVVGGTMDNPQFEFLRWNYFPLFAPSVSPLLNKNLGYIAGRFVNSMDTIKVPGVEKSILLASSANSRIISTPALISLNENKNVPEDEKFRSNGIPVGILLQGKFSSLYKNRVSQAQRDSLAAYGIQFKGESPGNDKIIVVSDGDMVLNDFLPVPNSNPVPLPMGWNRYTYREAEKQTEFGKMFIPVANREFLLNCMEYLVNSTAIMETRNKDIVLRLLDSKKINEQKSAWQFVNTALPVLLVILAGWFYQQLRRRKYAS